MPAYDVPLRQVPPRQLRRPAILVGDGGYGYYCPHFGGELHRTLEAAIRSAHACVNVCATTWAAQAQDRQR